MNQWDQNQMEQNQMNHAGQQNGENAGWQASETQDGYHAQPQPYEDAGIQGWPQARTDSRVDLAVKDLVEAVWDSPEYRRYQNIRAKVHAQPELEARIHAFRKKNYQTQNFTDERSLFDQADELEREGEQFRKNPLVNEYLDAELAICRLFQKINWELVQNIDFDLGFDAGW